MRITEHEKGSLHLGAVSFENSVNLFSREKPLSLNMKKHKSIENVVDNLQNSGRNEESVDEMKKKLKKEIDELKSIILQTECSFDIFLFKDIEVSYEQNNSDVSTDTDISEVPDINIELELELFRYAGVYCVEFSEKECVFNLSASNKYEKKSTYVVQILNANGERRLGKWIMPESIDLHTLISKFPINETKYIPQFIRICKHYVNCYFLRHEQCHALMVCISY
ncbi:uncharacterized protein LOC122395550 [Colletes gigas]|uniref:uncharacterized protein LOC122395550 n=1 Tax=Colletes gigas TaxID=935657 RepID=UPI001C9A9EDB|nr:uncharacterized protein LOC122395550 [Colletes gigas]